MKLKILFVDDEKVNLSNFELAYGNEYETAIFLGPKEALAWLDDNQDVVIVISDQRMGLGTGLEFLEKVSRKVPKAIRILVNSYVVTPEIEDAAKSGLISRCIQKPWNADDFAATLRMSRDYYLLSRKNDELLLKLSQTKHKLISAEDVFEQRLRERSAEFSAVKQILVEEIAGYRRTIAGNESRTVSLQDSLAQSKRMNGVVPICASCKKIRDKQGAWDHVEVYVERNSGVHFTHGICPECVQQVYSESSMTQYSELFVQPGKG